jgi:hypothetical protein
MFKAREPMLQKPPQIITQRSGGLSTALKS